MEFYLSIAVMILLMALIINTKYYRARIKEIERIKDRWKEVAMYQFRGDDIEK